MKNWKTSLFGSILGILLALPPGILPEPVQRVLTGITGACALFSAKDKDVTGAGDMARRVKD